MGNDQSPLTQHKTHQYILIGGGPSVVILQGMKDQQQSIINFNHYNFINDNTNQQVDLYTEEWIKKMRKEDSKWMREELERIYNLLLSELPQQYLNRKPLFSSSSCSSSTTLNHLPIIVDNEANEEQDSLIVVQFQQLKENLIELWNEPKCRELYLLKRFEMDPYLILPNIMTNLERGVKFNVKRNLYFKPITENQRYFTERFARIDNASKPQQQLLEFEMFAHCYSCDTWGDVIGVSFALSDYDNDIYLKDYFRVCESLARFDTYRIVLIFSHPDVLYEKIRLGRIKNARMEKDTIIRKELKQLPADCALIINSLITETLKIMKQNELARFGTKRTYEFHVVNTSHDGDMKELLNCLCIGVNEKRKCFITSKFELPPLPKVDSRNCKQKMYRSMQLLQFCDIVIETIVN